VRPQVTLDEISGDKRGDPRPTFQLLALACALWALHTPQQLRNPQSVLTVARFYSQLERTSEAAVS